MKQIAISHIFTSNSLHKCELKIDFAQLPVQVMGYYLSMLSAGNFFWKIKTFIGI